MFYGGIKYIFRTHDIRTDCLHREELTRRHLLQSGRREHIVHTFHRHIHGRLVADVADVILHFWILQRMTHVILLLLVPRKDTDFFDVAVQKATEDGVTERAGTTGD